MSDPNTYSNIIVNRERPIVFLDLCGTFANTLITHDILDGYGVDDDLSKTWLKIRNSPTCDVICRPIWEYVKRIFRRYSVQIIIVSSWTKSYLPKSSSEIRELSEFLEYNDILGSLCTQGGMMRGHHIANFVRLNKLTHWLVIDDAKEQMYHDSRLFTNNRFVHPHGRWGVGAKEIEKIEYLLSRGNNPWLNNTFELQTAPLYYLDPKEESQ